MTLRTLARSVRGARYRGRVFSVELRSVDRERNRFRVYRMWLQPTLFGGFDLVIEWGRIGARLRRRSENFTAERWDELVARRRRHGYEGSVAVSARRPGWRPCP